MAKPKDNEPSTNSEVQRSDEFQKEVEIKETTMEVAKDLLESTTENEFSKLGYEEVSKSAGEYGTEKKYGAGVEQNQFKIRVAGKTKTSLEKQVMLGAKRIQSDINFSYNGKMVNVEYKTTEAGFFRGVDSNSIPYTFTKTITIDGSKKTELEKQMKELFAIGAKKEVGYLTNTKLGVEDTTDKSTTSTVNENQESMKKLTIKSIFSNEDISDALNESKNSDNVKKQNTIPLDKTHPFDKSDEEVDKDKSLLFDDKEETDVNEVTTAGPSGAGAGAFLTPFAFKGTSYGKYKGKKKPTITKEYNVVPNSEGYNSDGFWQKVNVDALKDTHPLGMPGIKPGSKEEWDATTKGDKNKLKRLGLKEEVEAPKVNLDLTKKKIFSEAENVKNGVNKRYLITEKTSEEYLKDRWKKLTSFKLYESIQESEEINLTLNECECENKPVKSIDPLPIDKIEEKVELIEQTPEPINESKNILEETVTVQKPGSLFGIEYVFYKKDFLDENKKYILDLSSKVFVPNPNIK